MQVDSVVQKAFEGAVKVQNNAHAPYSNFHVGAAIKVKGEDKVFYGCNVENASYGATVCAERTAIQTSVANGKKQFEFLIVVTNTDPAIGPCGLCLQVISEFCSPDLPIYLANPKGIQRKVLFKDLLSSPFSKIPDQI
jgi:cytidine deaminase